MYAVINLALPVFAVIAVGVLAGRFKLMTGDEAQALNKFVFRFAMPAALFGLTAGTAPPGPEDFSLALSYGVAALTAIFGAYFLSQLLFPLTKEESGAHGLSSTLGNAVFLGLPIALTVEGWASPFVVLMLVEGIFIIAIGAALMTPRDSITTLSKRAMKFITDPFRNPLVAAAAAGFVFSALGFALTGPFELFFDILGRAAGPTALFSLGFIPGNPSVSSHWRGRWARRFYRRNQNAGFAPDRPWHCAFPRA